ncbi:hypothetical protein Tco_0260753 [Tanacetum coccineum]
MAETTRQTRKRFKDLEIKVKVKKKKAQDQRSHSMKEQAYNKDKDQELNVKAIPRNPRPCYDCEHGSSESIRNQASREIVSLKTSNGEVKVFWVLTDTLPPNLVADIDRDVRELYTRALWRPVLTLEAWAGHVDTWLEDTSRDRYDDHRLILDMLVQQAAIQRELQEMRGRVTALEQESDRRE